MFILIPLWQEAEELPLLQCSQGYDSFSDVLLSAEDELDIQPSR